MQQDQRTGAAGDAFGTLTAPKIAAKIGATMLGLSSNEATYMQQRVVIKCAGPTTSSVGVTYRMLERLQLIIAAFQDQDGVFQLFTLSAKAFYSHMRETRSKGASAQNVGIVTKKVFMTYGTMLGKVQF